jgi:hypothetical protein
MKTSTYYFFILFVFISLNALAQYDSEGADEISRFKPGTFWYLDGWRPATTDKIRKYDRLIFDITYNTWNGDKKIFSNSWNSLGLNTSLYFDIPLNSNNTISLGTGFGHQFYRIQYNSHITGDPTDTYTQMNDSLISYTFDKSFLGGNNFFIPIELRLRSKGWKHFKFHFGGKIGYQLGLYNKSITNTSVGKNIYINRGFPDIARLTYSAYLRFGFRNWALFGSYHFNPIFKNSLSPELNLIQMGISVSLF